MCFELEDELTRSLSVFAHPSSPLSVFGSFCSSGQRLSSERLLLHVRRSLGSYALESPGPQRPHLFSTPSLLHPPPRSHKARHYPPLSGSAPSIPSPTCANLPHRDTSPPIVPLVIYPLPLPLNVEQPATIQRSASKPSTPHTRARIHAPSTAFQ